MPKQAQLDALPWRDVVSSHVARLAWTANIDGGTTADGTPLGKLWVEYKTGKIYEYDDAAEDKFDTLLEAKSVGSMLRKVVGALEYGQVFVEDDPDALAARVASLEAKVANLEKAIQGALRVPPQP